MKIHSLLLLEFWVDLDRQSSVQPEARLKKLLQHAAQNNRYKFIVLTPSKFGRLKKC